jgi:hypothetical protein
MNRRLFVGGCRMIRRLVVTVFIVAVGGSVVPTLAQAVTISDPDDVGPRLDIRSVATVQIHHHLQLTLVFWDRTPIWLLGSRAARLEMSTRAPSHAQPLFGFRFWPNGRGRLRITYGDPGSSCCGRHGAQHPDPFTYTALIKFSLAHPLGDVDSDPIKTFRGSTTRTLSCGFSRRCGLLGGRLIDKTPWTRV